MLDKLFFRAAVCDLNDNSDDATKHFQRSTLLSPLADLEHKTLTQFETVLFFCLPALSSVVQLMGASHSISSIVVVVALSRTYLD